VQLRHLSDRGRQQLEHRHARYYSVLLHYHRCEEGQRVPAVLKSRRPNPIIRFPTRRITAGLLGPALVRTRTKAKSVEQAYNVDDVRFRAEPAGSPNLHGVQGWGGGTRQRGQTRKTSHDQLCLYHKLVVAARRTSCSNSPDAARQTTMHSNYHNVPCSLSTRGTIR
jgi:hypothetical protein